MTLFRTYRLKRLYAKREELSFRYRLLRQKHLPREHVARDLRAVTAKCLRLEAA